MYPSGQNIEIQATHLGGRDQSTRCTKALEPCLSLGSPEVEHIDIRVEDMQVGGVED